MHAEFLLNTKHIVRCCIYLTTYDWIKSFLKITIERRAIYGNLENKINTQEEIYRKRTIRDLFCPLRHHKNINCFSFFAKKTFLEEGYFQNIYQT
jgi:hypothetical protein